MVSVCWSSFSFSSEPCRCPRHLKRKMKNTLSQLFLIVSPGSVESTYLRSYIYSERGEMHSVFPWERQFIWMSSPRPDFPFVPPISSQLSEDNLRGSLCLLLCTFRTRITCTSWILGRRGVSPRVAHLPLICWMGMASALRPSHSQPSLKWLLLLLLLFQQNTKSSCPTDTSGLVVLISRSEL